MILAGSRQNRVMLGQEDIRRRKKKMQKVIRTFPETYTRPTEDLQKALSEGYEVVMCHPIHTKYRNEGLEYIVEKKGESTE